MAKKKNAEILKDILVKLGGDKEPIPLTDIYPLFAKEKGKKETTGLKASVRSTLQSNDSIFKKAGRGKYALVGADVEEKPKIPEADIFDEDKPKAKPKAKKERPEKTKPSYEVIGVGNEVKLTTTNWKDAKKKYEEIKKTKPEYVGIWRDAEPMDAFQHHSYQLEEPVGEHVVEDAFDIKDISIPTEVLEKAPMGVLQDMMKSVKDGIGMWRHLTPLSRAKLKKAIEERSEKTEEVSEAPEDGNSPVGSERIILNDEEEPGITLSDEEETEEDALEEFDSPEIVLPTPMVRTGPSPGSATQQPLGPTEVGKTYTLGENAIEEVVDEVELRRRLTRQHEGEKRKKPIAERKKDKVMARFLSPGWFYAAEDVMPGSVFEEEGAEVQWMAEDPPRQRFLSPGWLSSTPETPKPGSVFEEEGAEVQWMAEDDEKKFEEMVKGLDKKKVRQLKNRARRSGDLEMADIYEELEEEFEVPGFDLRDKNPSVPLPFTNEKQFENTYGHEPYMDYWEYAPVCDWFGPGRRSWIMKKAGYHFRRTWDMIAHRKWNAIPPGYKKKIVVALKDREFLNRIPTLYSFPEDEQTYGVAGGPAEEPYVQEVEQENRLAWLEDHIQLCVKELEEGKVTQEKFDKVTDYLYNQLKVMDPENGLLAERPTDDTGTLALWCGGGVLGLLLASWAYDKWGNKQ